MAKRPVSRTKAREILEHGEARGHKLTKKQRGLFGAIAGGSPLKKYHNSPDVYDDTALGETPPKREYHAEQENLHTREGKRAGGTPAGVQQHSGTESPRVETETRMAAAKSTPSGGARRWPSGVDRFNDDEV
jgi:hypothetical protein